MEKGDHHLFSVRRTDRAFPFATKGENVDEEFEAALEKLGRQTEVKVTVDCSRQAVPFTESVPAAYGFPDLYRDYVAFLSAERMHYKKAEQLEQRLHELSLADSRGQKSGLFNSVIDESRLAYGLSQLHAKFFGMERKAVLEGENRNEIDFSAYLFLLVEALGLGNDIFYEKGKKPFFRFICEKVIVGLDKSDRTFLNRLKEMDDLRRQIKNRSLGKLCNTPKNGETHRRNFLMVLKLFLKGDFYREMKRLKLSEAETLTA